MDALKRPRPFYVYRSYHDLAWCVDMLDPEGGWCSYTRVYKTDTYREAIDYIDRFVRDYMEEG